MIPRPSGGARVTRLALPLVLLALAACGDGGSGSTNPSPGGTVNYAGAFASAASSGVVRFGSGTAALTADGRVAAVMAPIALTGTLTFTSGTVVSLSGTLNGTVLVLTGSGYSFNGTAVNGNVISGTFTGPGGESGTFSVTLSSSTATVKVLCGEYTGDDSGTFSLALLPDRTGGVVVGNQTGIARPKSGTTDKVEVLPDAAPTFVIATGTLTNGGSDIAGNWQDPSGAAGTFQGSVAACTGGGGGTSGTTFKGFVLGDSRLNGGLVLTFAAAPTGTNTVALVAGSTITPVSGTPITLTGSATSDGGFSATGGGYTFTGVVDAGVVYGNWGPPNAFSVGAFAATTNGVAYCGRYTPAGNVSPGNFDVLVSGTAVAGGFRGDPADSPIYGTFNTTASGGSYTYASSGTGFSYSVTGTTNATTASGNVNWTGQGIFNAGDFTINGPYTASRCPGT